MAFARSFAAQDGFVWPEKSLHVNMANLYSFSFFHPSDLSHPNGLC
uniref:Uncharacterized protein n=1 Tax=Setaria italica TaxID=4555 RepID=K3ZPC6_SETIT